MNLGLSGRLTRTTISSPLTPLFLMAAIAVGLLALLSIPREEEPQISVPMVDIQVAAPGMSAADAVELVGIPLETIVKSVDGVEHVYTQAEDDGVMVTAVSEGGESAVTLTVTTPTIVTDARAALATLATALQAAASERRAVTAWK